MPLVPKLFNTGNLVTLGGNLVNQLQTESLVAKENIQMGEALYIKQSDGGVYRSFASADGKAESDEVRFFAMTNYYVGQNIAAIEGPVNIGYSDGTALKGANVYLAIQQDIPNQHVFPVPFGYRYVSEENTTVAAAALVTTVAARGRLSTTPAYNGQSAVGYLLSDGARIHLFASSGRSVSVFA